MVPKYCNVHFLWFCVQRRLDPFALEENDLSENGFIYLLHERFLVRISIVYKMIVFVH